MVAESAPAVDEDVIVASIVVVVVVMVMVVVMVVVAVVTIVVGVANRINAADIVIVVVVVDSVSLVGRPRMGLQPQPLLSVPLSLPRPVVGPPPVGFASGWHQSRSLIVDGRGRWDWRRSRAYDFDGDSPFRMKCSCAHLKLTTSDDMLYKPVASKLLVVVVCFVLSWSCYYSI